MKLGPLDCHLCYERVEHEFETSVVCDGCHKWVHRDCAGDYRLVPVEWDPEYPHAYIFCLDCDGD